MSAFHPFRSFNRARLDGCLAPTTVIPSFGAGFGKQKFAHDFQGEVDPRSLRRVPGVNTAEPGSGSRTTKGFCGCWWNTGIR
jgi:hypothetical protein